MVIKNIQNEIKSVLGMLLSVNINDKENTIKIEDLNKILDRIANKYNINNETIANKLAKQDKSSK